MRAISAFAPRDNYHLLEISLDSTVLAFSLVQRCSAA